MAIGAGAIAAGKGYLELFLKTDKINPGLASVAKRMSKWSLGIGAVGASIAGVSATILTPLYALADSAAHGGDKLQKMSERTGTSVQALSALGFAAEQSGQDIDVIETALTKMNKTLGSALGAKALAKLKLTMADLRGLSPDKQLEVIAEAVSKLGTQAEKTAALMAIFGRGGAALGSLFKDGAKGIQELRKEAEELGIVASPERTKAAAEYIDAWNRVARVSKSIKSAIGGAIVPAMTQMADVTLRMLVPVRDFIKAHKEWVPVIFRVGLVLSAVASVITAVAVGGLILSGIIAGLAAAWAMLVAVVGFLLSPIGLVIMGVTALVAAFMYFSGIGATLIKMFGGITAALMSGQWALAGKIAITGMAVAWLQGINLMSNMWVRFKYFVLGLMQSIADGIADIWERITHRLAVEMLGIKGLINPLFDSEQAIKDLDEQRAKKLKERDAQRAKRNDDAMKKELDPYKAEIEKAQRDLDALIAQAKKTKKKFEPYKLEMGPAAIAKLEPKALDTRGTFSGFAARMLKQAAPSVNEKIKEGIDDVNKKLEELIDEVKNGGAEFAG